VVFVFHLLIVVGNRATVAPLVRRPQKRSPK
jgi:hypothetical protein